MNGDSTTDPAAQRLQSLRTITMVVYALQAAFFMFGVSALVAIIINYVKKDDVQGTWLESHFRWQIRTFWIALAWAGFALLTLLLLVGYPLLIACGVWVIYRIVKGWLNLIDGKAMYLPPPDHDQP